jgi:hypothetical protein
MLQEKAKTTTAVTGTTISLLKAAKDGSAIFCSMVSLRFMVEEKMVLWPQMASLIVGFKYHHSKYMGIAICYGMFIGYKFMHQIEFFLNDPVEWIEPENTGKRTD